MEQLKYSQNQSKHLTQNIAMKTMSYLPFKINLIDYAKSKSILIILLLLISTSSFGQWTANLWERFERACAMVIPKLAFVALFLLFTNLANAQWMLINQTGGTPNASAALELQTTDRGFLAPRMTTPQMNAISTPAAGLLIYNTDSSAFFYNNGSGWANIASAGATQFAVPAGSILSFAGDTANVPAGFLLCNGASLAQASYSELYAAIGKAWGGDATNFNLPDLRGRFLRGTAYGSTNDPDRAARTAISTGGNTGDKVGSVQGDNFGSHTHGSGSLSGTYRGRNTDDGGTAQWGAEMYTFSSFDRNSTSSSLNISGSTSTSGGNETRPVNANVNYIICYSSSIAAAGTNSSVFQGSISSAQLPNSVQDSSRITDNDGSAKVQALSSDVITLNTSSTEAMRIASNGYVGINTNSPQQLLDVAGTAVIDSLRIYNAYAFPGDDGTNGQVLQTDGNGKATWQTPTPSPWTVSGSDVYRSSGKVGIGTSSPNTSLHLHTAASVGNYVEITNGTSLSRGLQLGINNAGVAYILQKENFDLNIRTNDIDRVTIQAGGNVGIGTTTPSGMLTLYGDSSNLLTLQSSDNDKNNGIAFQNSGGAYAARIFRQDAGTNDADLVFASGNASADITTLTEQMRIKYTGEVGIGTASPTADLTIASTNTATVRLNTYGSTLNEASILYLTRARGTESSPSAVVDGDNIARINAVGYDGSTYQSAARIRMSVDGTPGTNDMPGRIEFHTTPDGSATNSERMRITNSGNVGIGTNAPATKLHVTGTAVADGSSGQIQIDETGGNSMMLGRTASFGFIQTQNSEPLVLNPTSNNVGIGTSTPDAQLHVAGKTQFSEDDDAITFESAAGVKQATIGITDGNGRFNLYQGADSSGDYYIQTGEAATRLRMHNTGFHFYTAPAGTADDLVPWDEQVTILNTGLVGIGQGTPTSKLHVLGNTTIDQTATSTTGFVIRRSDDLSNVFRVFTGTGKNGSLALHDALGATQVKLTSGTDDSYLTGIGEFGLGLSNPKNKLHVNSANTVTRLQLTNSTSGNGAGDGLLVSSDATNAIITNQESGDIEFNTNSADRMIIKSDGDVGIGTGSPVARLQVVGGDVLLDNTKAIDGLLAGGSAVNLIRVSSADHVQIGDDAVNDVRINVGSKLNAMVVEDGGEVGIGTTSPINLLHVEGTETSDAILLVHNTSGNVQADGIYVQTGANNNPGNSNAFLRCQDGDGDNIGKITGNGSGGVTYNTTSDRRLKTNIEDYTNGLELVMQIQPRIYERKSLLGKKEIGFIAQELQQVLPMAVSGDSTIDVSVDPMGVDYGLLTPVLAAGIKELHELVKQQQAIIDGQKSKIKQLEAAREEDALLQEETNSRLDAIEKLLLTGAVMGE